MSDDPGLLTQIGVRVPSMFAGFAGGLVGAYADGRSGYIAWTAYVVCGGLTSNFLAEPARQFLPGLNEGGAGFIIGLCSLIIARTLIGAAKRWHPPGNGNGAR